LTDFYTTDSNSKT